MAFQDVLDGVVVDTATAEHRQEAELLHWLIQVGHSRDMLQLQLACAVTTFSL